MEIHKIKDELWEHVKDLPYVYAVGITKKDGILSLVAFTDDGLPLVFDDFKGIPIVCEKYEIGQA